MLNLFSLFAAVSVAHATVCVLKDPKTKQIVECNGEYCMLGKFLNLPMKEIATPVIAHGCFNGSGIGDEDLGCFQSIPDMDTSKVITSLAKILTGGKF